MKEKILEKLKKVEKDYSVQILYAIESGSRAWGFQSVNSDYDVRFIYLHDLEWYLKIKPEKDNIEIPIVDELDFAGWDLKKSLALLYKSNPVLFEWLHSPIVYVDYEDFGDSFRTLANEYFSVLTASHHYLSMARNNYKAYLNKDKVRLKKYFYALRPILACEWIEKFCTAPPMKFERLLDLVKDEIVKEKILELLEEKRSGKELGETEPIKVINSFVSERINYYKEKVKSYKKDSEKDRGLLDKFFVNMVSMC